MSNVINLTKGQRIDLTKENGQKLERICVGVNWGRIIEKRWLGGTKTKPVDLDASIGIFDAQGRLIDKVYFGKLTAPGITHSGDDREGDTDGDDGLDNEIIEMDLTKVDPNASFLAIVLNSFTKIDFGKIPYASVRIYEGTPSRVDEVFAQFNIAGDPDVAGKVCMILGGVYRNGDQWKFNSIGQGTSDRSLERLLDSAAKFAK